MDKNEMPEQDNELKFDPASGQDEDAAKDSGAGDNAEGEHTHHSSHHHSSHHHSSSQDSHHSHHSSHHHSSHHSHHSSEDGEKKKKRSRSRRSRSKRKLRQKIIVASSIAAALVAVVLIVVLTRGEHDHVWSEWETTIEPTCNIAGQEKAVCSCGEVKYREIPTTHEYEKEETDVLHKKCVFVCSLCGREMTQDMTSEELGLHIVSISGSLFNISSKNAVMVDVVYDAPGNNFTSKATIKIQGATSTAYPKKNYTIKFKDEYGNKKKVTILDEWGEHSKYCLKANYIDATSSRNIVAAKLYGQIGKTLNKDDRISGLTNCGAIDGFPVAVYLNGDFLGLYTFNTPKDEYIFGLKDAEINQALIAADDYTDQTKLSMPISDSFEKSGFSVEYYTSELGVGAEWMTASFNDLIAFVNENDGVEFREGISEYVDVDRAIDEMLFVYAIAGSDNTSKNTLWVTYDGKQWIPSPYDLDATFGLYWDGSTFLKPGIETPKTAKNTLWIKLNKNFYDEICKRWAELRSGPLSLENIEKTFFDFMSQIPDQVAAAEMERWPDVPLRGENNLEQIMQYEEENLEIIDGFYGLN
ncbi:MAG: CotH kinase family protein [Clostridia bacterium]|nr:CotH kinase family protein [Clostridia bacterium]